VNDAGVAPWPKNLASQLVICPVSHFDHEMNVQESMMIEIPRIQKPNRPGFFERPANCHTCEEMLREQEKLNARLVRDGRVEDWKVWKVCNLQGTITFPTWGIGKSSSKVPLKGDMLVSVNMLNWILSKIHHRGICNLPRLQDHIDFVQSRKVCAILQVQRLSTLQSAVFLSLWPIMFEINFCCSTWN